MLSTHAIQVSRLGGAGDDEVQSHHHHEDGHSNRPPLRSHAYATKLTAPTTVQVVTRSRACASF